MILLLVISYLFDFIDFFNTLTMAQREILTKILTSHPE